MFCNTRRHSLGWKFLSATPDTLERSGVLHAIPPCLLEKFQFHRLLYCREISKAGWYGAEVAFSVSRRYEVADSRNEFCLQLICSKQYFGLKADSSPPDCWGDDALSWKREIAGLFDSQTSTCEPGCAYLLMPDLDTLSTGYIDGWELNIQSGKAKAKFTSSSVLWWLRRWFGFGSVWKDSSLYCIQSALSLPCQDDGLVVLTELIDERKLSTTDCFRLSLSLSQLMVGLAERDIVLCNLDTDTIVVDSAGVYWITDWSSMVWKEVELTLTFPGWPLHLFDGNRQDTIKACISKRVSNDVQVLSSDVVIHSIQELGNATNGDTATGTCILIYVKVKDQQTSDLVKVLGDNDDFVTNLESALLTHDLQERSPDDKRRSSMVSIFVDSISPGTNEKEKRIKLEMQHAPRFSPHGWAAGFVPEVLCIEKARHELASYPSTSAGVYALGVLLYRLLTSKYPDFNCIGSSKKLHDDRILEVSMSLDHSDPTFHRRSGPVELF